MDISKIKKTGGLKMDEEIMKYLNENKTLVHETIDYAAKESVDVSESGFFKEKISVALNDDYELEVFTHHSSYWYPEFMIYVIASMACESYIVDYSDVEDFLNEGQLKKFNSFLLNDEDVKAYLRNEFDPDDLADLTSEELFTEARYYINDEHKLLDLLEAFDSNLYEEFMKDMYEGLDL